MKRALILSVFMLCLAVTGAFAIGDLPTTTNGSWIQGPAPNGLLSQFLTVNSTTIDMSNNTWWSIMAPAAGCKYRILPTTAKGSYPAFTAPTAQAMGKLVNVNSSFVNFTGCALAELERF